MSYNPFRDAKFLTGLLDTIISLVLYFVGRFYPAAQDDVKFAILAIQPIALMLIAGFFQRDSVQIALVMRQSVEGNLVLTPASLPKHLTKK